MIYWAWNNTLSVLQQSVIMKRNGAKIELWDNLHGAVQEKAADDVARRSSGHSGPPRSGGLGIQIRDTGL